jgi:hypothetical protein
MIVEVFNAYLAAGGVVGPTVTVRASGMLDFFASSATLNFAALGAQAGDKLILIGGHAFPFSSLSLSGFTQHDASGGSFWGGHTHSKTLTSGDITTGSVTANYTGSFQGYVTYVLIAGGTLRHVTAARDGTSTLSETKTSDSSPVAGDLAILHGSVRNSVTVSCPSTTTITSVSHANGAGGLFTDTVPSNGVYSRTLSFSGGSSASYTAQVIVGP